MKKFFKLLMLGLMIMGIVFSIINFISVDNFALRNTEGGTVQSDGCYGAELNC